jgi:hypothetical protein
MTAIDITALEASVEALIQQQLAVYEAQLREALARTLARARPSSPRRKETKKPKSAPARRTSSTQRRSADEIDAFAERLFAAVESAPGETMAVLAPRLGVSAKELERPAARLKKAGQIRTVGERSRMRYYPMARAAA